MSHNLEKGVGGGLIILGLFLGINPLTLIIAIPVILGGLFFLFKRRRR